MHTAGGGGTLHNSLLQAFGTVSLFTFPKVNIEGSGGAPKRCKDWEVWSLGPLQITLSLLHCCLSTFSSWNGQSAGSNEKSRWGLTSLGNLKTQFSFYSFSCSWLHVYPPGVNWYADKVEKSSSFTLSLVQTEQSETQFGIWYLVVFF